MKRRTCLVAVLAAPFAVRAHHGWSSFNIDQPVFIEGRVVAVKWQNPHAELVVELPPDYKVPYSHYHPDPPEVRLAAELARRKERLAVQQKELELLEEKLRRRIDDPGGD